ncbi:MAG: BON domain-containing protein [Rickettsiaceae bacterium]|nr:BON domain-containing protein [Rickettsiaceae bacterium]
MKKFNFIILVFVLFELQACMPTIFAAATTTTFATAKDRSLGNTIDDVIISTTIRKEFISHGFKKLYTKINVEVVQGRVLLTGDVESQDDIISAVDIVWSISGVTEVINELKISEDSNKFDPVQFAQDSWISTQIKTSIFFDRSIKFVNYTIITKKNIVYIFGIARSASELEKVTDIASKIAGVEKVLSYAHLKENKIKKITNSADYDDDSIISQNFEDAVR